MVSFRGLIQNFPRASPPLSYWIPPSPGVSTFQMVGEHFSFHRSYSKIRLFYSLKELHVLSYLVGVQTVVDCEQSLFFFRFSEERVSRVSLDGLRPKRGTAHSLKWGSIWSLAFIICCAFFPSVGCQIRSAIRQVIGPSEQETENSPCCKVKGRKSFA